MSSCQPPSPPPKAFLLFLLLSALCLLLASPALAGDQLLSVAPGGPLGPSGPPRPTDDLLRRVDSANGSTLNVEAQISLAGQQVKGANGLARHPQTGVLYIFPKLGGPQTASLLATLDESTGIATSVGSTGQRMATMAFADDGTLYAVSGNQSIIAHGLFTVDTATGLSTLLGTLDNGSDDGQALAHNPVDGLLYHAAGLGNRNNNNGEIFEKLDPDTCTGSPQFDCDPTRVDLSGDDYLELTVLVYLDGGFFAGDLGDTDVDMPRFFRITTTGVVTDLGPMDHVSKGLVRALPQLPTLPTSLLGVLAASLATFGCWNLARASRAARV